jgi:hypothetical protein
VCVIVSGLGLFDYFRPTKRPRVDTLAAGGAAFSMLTRPLAVIPLPTLAPTTSGHNGCSATWALRCTELAHGVRSAFVPSIRSPHRARSIGTKRLRALLTDLGETIIITVGSQLKQQRPLRSTP